MRLCVCDWEIYSLSYVQIVGNGLSVKTVDGVTLLIKLSREDALEAFRMLTEKGYCRVSTYELDV